MSVYTIEFDPWRAGTRSIREILFHLSTRNIRNTNSRCTLKTVVKSDNSEPQLILQFEDNTGVIFKTERMTLYDLIYLFQSYVDDKNNVEEQ
ncbi:hypothetical protein GJ496_011282 [Pomphorhynchus laevis]|nr:hypothetical protein GJ496_011282 [Pomphorhynchus laevis]